MSLKQFSKLNLTSQIVSLPVDESCTTATETNATFIDRYRDDLPIYRSREVILKSIAESPVVIIKGPTGCGKVN